MLWRHRKEFIAAFKEAMDIYRHAKAKCDKVNAGVEMVKSPDDLVYSTQHQPAHTRRKTFMMTNLVKTTKRELTIEVGDILSYSNCKDATMGSESAKRVCRVVKLRKINA